MGVTGLWQILSPAGRPVSLESLDGQVLAVDVSIWLNQAISAMRDSSGHAIFNAHLLNLYQRLCKLMYFHVRPVFVFDGTPPALKQSTLRARRQRKEAAREERHDIDGKLLNNFLRQHALNHVAQERGGVTGAPVAAPPKLPPRGFLGSGRGGKGAALKDAQMFRLPRVEEEKLQPDGYQSAVERHWQERKQIVDYVLDSDLIKRNMLSKESVDFDSPDFKALPLDVQHEILREIKLRRKDKHSWHKIKQMPKNPSDFMEFQLKSVLFRGKVTHRLDKLENEMKRESAGDIVTSLTKRYHDNEKSNSVIVDASKIAASEDGGHYVYIKNDDKRSFMNRIEEENRKQEEEDSKIKMEEEAEVKTETRDAVGEDMGRDINHELERYEPESDSDESDDERWQREEEALENAIVLSLQHRSGEGIGSVRKKSTESRPNFGQMLDRLASDDMESVWKVSSLPAVPEVDLAEASSSALKNGVRREEEEEEETVDEEDRDLRRALALSLQGSNVEGDADTRDDDVVIEKTANAVEETRTVGEEQRPAKDDASTSRIAILEMLEKQKAALRSREEEVSLVDDGNLAADVKGVDDGSAPKPVFRENIGNLDVSFVQRMDFPAKSGGETPESSEDDSDGDFEEVPDRPEASFCPSAPSKGSLVANREKRKSCDASSSVSPNVRSVEKPVPENTRPARDTEGSNEDSDDDDFEEVPDQPEASSLCPPAQSKRFGHSHSTKTPNLGKRQEDSEDDDNFEDDASSASPIVELVEENFLENDEPVADVDFHLKSAGNENVSHKETSLPIDRDAETPSPVMREDSEDRDLSKTYQAHEEAERNLFRNLGSKLDEERMLLEESRQKQDRVDVVTTDQMTTDCQELLRLFGVPYVVAASEAEAQCAFLESVGLTQGTVTDDSDVWLFGGRVVYRNFFKKDKDVERFKLEDVESHLRLDRSKMICFAMLTGSDYTDGVEGVGGVTAFEFIHEFRVDGLDGLRKLRGWWEKAAKVPPGESFAAVGSSKVKNRLRQLSLSEGFPSEVVYNAYVDPSVDESLEEFSWAGSPDIDGVREFARVKFGWNREKTDESLLPVVEKMKERKSNTIDKWVRRWSNQAVAAKKALGIPSQRVKKVLVDLNVLAEEDLAHRPKGKIKGKMTDGDDDGEKDEVAIRKKQTAKKPAPNTTTKNNERKKTAAKKRKDDFEFQDPDSVALIAAASTNDGSTDDASTSSAKPSTSSKSKPPKPSASTTSNVRVDEPVVQSMPLSRRKKPSARPSAGGGRGSKRRLAQLNPVEQVLAAAKDDDDDSAIKHPKLLRPEVDPLLDAFSDDEDDDEMTRLAMIVEASQTDQQPKWKSRNHEKKEKKQKSYKSVADLSESGSSSSSSSSESD